MAQRVNRTTESADTIGYGRLRRGLVYHATHTTMDRDSKGSHIRTLEESFNQNDVRQCWIMEQNVQCPKAAEVGAHVYFNNDFEATAEEVQIIPTCKGHNHYLNCANKEHNFGGQGVEVANGTPYILRRIRPRAFGGKGAAWGGLPDGPVDEANLVAASLECFILV